MITIRELKTDEAGTALALWTAIPVLAINSEFDTPQRIARFLERNPGLSAAAFEGERLVGALMCGQDGRRGFFYHTGVEETYRGRGIAQKMVDFSCAALRAQGIDSCFLFTYDRNLPAQQFWKAMGFEYAPHVMYHSKSLT